jgi:hypothetical protein
MPQPEDQTSRPCLPDLRDKDSATRLIGAALVQQHEEWQHGERRCMPDASIRDLVRVLHRAGDPDPLRDLGRLKGSPLAPRFQGNSATGCDHTGDAAFTRHAAICIFRLAGAGVPA